MSVTRATAFAPATIANVAVGFDLLGFPISSVGDTVHVSKNDSRQVKILSVTDNYGKAITLLPFAADKNTATVGLIRLIEDLELDFGFDVSLKKGIALGSGMGGSASSAVGAMVAANALLESPLSKPELLKYALLGESVASGSAHADNIAPCLWGGITLVRSLDPIEIVTIPTPSKVLCLLVHPHMRLDTLESRKVLQAQLTLKDHVKQSACLGSFIAGCFKDDLALIKSSLHDFVIEPQRSPLIPGFREVKGAANSSGALGCSISGSGPSVFAWFDSEVSAENAKTRMIAAFQKAGIADCDAWISPISSEGAKVIP